MNEDNWTIHWVEGSSANLIDGGIVSEGIENNAPPYWFSGSSTAVLGATAFEQELANLGSSEAEWKVPISPGTVDRAYLLIGTLRYFGGLHSTRFDARVDVIVDGKQVDGFALRIQPENHKTYFHRIPLPELPSLPPFSECQTLYAWPLRTGRLHDSDVHDVRLRVEKDVRWDIDFLGFATYTDPRMSERIPTSFLQYATSILAETNQGLTGPQIVEVCNAWAVDENVDTPHASYPFDAGNKRTALLENLQRFKPKIQFRILSELCDHPNLQENPDVQKLRNQLFERFGARFNAPPVFAPSPSPTAVPPAPSAAPFQIFLCHASADKPRVRELYKWLKQQGYTPWLDEEDLLPGQDWALEIPVAVRNSSIVMVCLSQHAVDNAGYVQKEIKLALDVADEQPEGTIFIIPARLENCTVPHRLSKYHWVNLFEEVGYTKLLRAFGARRQGNP